MSVVLAENITKTYGPTVAVDNISFNVESNEIFGFIGPDGAGKTSMFRILTTLLLPDSGKAIVLGHNTVTEYKQLRRKLGYMPGRFSLYEDLTVEENLRFFASIFGGTIEDNYDLIKDIYIQIEPFKGRKAGNLSGGMKQKLALSCALIHKPELLVLDEPTTGVDAVSRMEFWEMLKNLKARGITIIVSTPYMDEASLCDRVALIQNGRILDIDQPDSIIKKYEKALYEIKSDDIYKLLLALRNYQHTDTVFPFGEFLHYTDKRERIDDTELTSYLEGKGCNGLVLRQTRPGIEDSFMALMRGANDNE